MLTSAARMAAGATVLSAAVPVLASCASPRIAEPPIGVGPPRIPEDSPDFDTLNSLLQLEFREVALAAEVSAGDRLDPAPARLAGEIRDHHLEHINALSRLIESVGGEAGEPRERYVLPTPLGDQRRALDVLLQSESALANTYTSAIARMLIPQLAPVLASNLFAEATHVAALRVLLDEERAIVPFA